MGYTNSSLVTFTKISPNKTKNRTHKIDSVAIHCMAGNGTVEGVGAMFAKSSTKASSNYGVDSKGKIGLYVEEKDRSWCTCSGMVDNRSVTIEVANDGGASTGWHVNNTALKSLLLLLVDICKRNGIPKLTWTTNKTDRKNQKVNMYVHRDWANKSCPGDFLYNLHGWISESVNAILSGKKTINDIVFPDGKKPTPTPVTPTPKPVTPTPATSTTIDYKTLTFNGVNLAPAYNATYYMNKYPDLKTAFGTNQQLLFEHFCKCGITEGRQAIASFWVTAYKKNYTDLQKAFGDNNMKYVAHWCTNGYKEGRKGI